MPPMRWAGMGVDSGMNQYIRRRRVSIRHAHEKLDVRPQCDLMLEHLDPSLVKMQFQVAWGRTKRGSKPANTMWVGVRFGSFKKR